MRRPIGERLDRAVRILGGVALVVAISGVVVYLDSNHHRAVGRDFLARGLPVVATDIELRVKSGRGGTYVDEVAVVFPTATNPRQRATLVSNLGDPEGAEPGQLRPAPGTRYAAPLALLYLPDDHQVMATVDARFFAEDDETPRVALGMIAGGVILATVVVFRRGVPRLPRRRERPPRQPPRHSKP